jgi:hypothetical protein
VDLFLPDEMNDLDAVKYAPRFVQYGVSLVSSVPMDTL